MGSFQRFDGNEEEIMEVFIKQKIDYKTDLGKETIDGYSGVIKSLLRRKFIQKIGDIYSITDRGRSAITQQIKTGDFYVAPLNIRPFNPNKSAKIRVPKEYGGYFT
jgi:hypothetical protein